ncbi:PQQ-dependent sugar dehydrogenase [Belliella kenyensis]|uniref:PQQ-dependent sugar dehydrogenase n=1 Tax=Belliella kenyensis TaxID=1472724 RepID=A0ABV8EIV0_9BACT|nr:PQQ-dependent sugar dehydrogenase [Belliella kenyensis]MCH7400328.1 PQQ-dependent sugar dehydrogenase [Belliella kenyensis]MDN3604654.1 PQQ-dependent sugar dehydrogenase [Belliella kenyensis]
MLKTHNFHHNIGIQKMCVLLSLSFLFTIHAVTAQVKTVNQIIENEVKTDKANVKITQIVKGLEHPWAMAWLPDGSMLVTERPGNMYHVSGDKVIKLSGLPKIDTDEDQLTAPQGGNQGGLLDLVMHPKYEENGWIYFTYSSPGDDDSVTDGSDYGTGTALARAKIDLKAGKLTDVETLYAQVPRTNPGRHYGSRIIFPGDGSVLFSIGDRGLRWNSQDLTDPAGSIIRIKEDGGIPEGNPLIGMAPGNLRPEIFSFGHRNNQGLAIDPETGQIWTTEHGPNGGDLLHKVEKGNNYGWPQVAFGTEYDTSEKIGLGEEAPGVTKPKHVWRDNMAPSGLAFYHQGRISNWNKSLFAGSLLKEEVYRIEIQNDEVKSVETLFSKKIGRIRDVRQGPDGNLYLLTDEKDGGVFKVELVN